jgi:hypothetical protein
MIALACLPAHLFAQKNSNIRYGLLAFTNRFLVREQRLLLFDIFLLNAGYRDAPDLKALFQPINQATDLTFLINRVELIFNADDHRFYIAKDAIKVLGFASIHFLPKLTCEGYLTYVARLVVNESVNSRPALLTLEKDILKQSKYRNSVEMVIDGRNRNLPETLLNGLSDFKALRKIYCKELK